MLSGRIIHATLLLIIAGQYSVHGRVDGMKRRMNHRHHIHRSHPASTDSEGTHIHLHHHRHPSALEAESTSETETASSEASDIEDRTIGSTSLSEVATTASASSFTPNGIKAGIAGGDAYPFLQNHIGWWYDWSPNPSKPGKPIGVPMLWGGGTADSTDASRLTQFKKITTPPTYVLGYEEPDCVPGQGSAGMTVAAGASKWDSIIAPLGKKGSKLGSPSMCKQADETWLEQFEAKIHTQWDFTAIHINKNNMAGVRKDIDHYWNTYGKPIWVTEFACVDDKNGFTPCTNQGEINNFISQIVPLLEAHPHVYAYAYSNGMGLGNVWPLMKGKSLSASGQAYLAAISKFH